MISEKTLQHPVLVLMIFSLLFVMGVFTLGNVAISLMPETENPYLMVSASYPNAGPASVEKSVTTIIEDALVGLGGLENMTSSSSEGSCSVGLEFKYGTDLEEAKNDVRDKLSSVSRRLPDGVTTNIRQFGSNNSPIMQIALKGNRSANDLKAIADNYVVDVLEQAEGVGEATSSGGRKEIVRVELEQNRLAAYGLTLSSVSNALASENLELGGGTVTEGTTNYSIRTVGEYANIGEINDTVITTINGYDLKLSDIGKAYLGYEDTTSEVYINGQLGVYISVTKQSGANSVTVANAVYKKIEEAKKLIPSDVSMEIISDESTSIRSTISDLIESAITGLLLAVIVLFVFLCNFKSTLIIAASIPVSIIITLLSMYFAGLTLNMMTLTGLILGVGMIVDASIVMIDNIYAYRSRGAKPSVSAILGSQEMLMSVLSGNLTTICVFIPFLFFMSDLGWMGQMFKGIIFTVVIALVSSLFVAVFLVPVLAGYFLPLSNRNEKPVRNFILKGLYAFFNKIQDTILKGYSIALKAALNNRFITFMICISLLAASIMLIFTMKIQMMTGGSDTSVTLNISLPIGTSLEQTGSVVNEFQKIVEDEVKGYKTIITNIGGGRGSRTYQGSIKIELGNAEEIPGADNSRQVQDKLRKYFENYTDVTFSFGRGFRQQLTGDDLNLALRGDDLDEIMSVANKIVDVMNQMPDIGEPSIDTTEGLPQVEIEIDRERAYNFGVNVQTVANEINYCINGKTSTVYRHNGTDYNVYVMLQPSDRSQVIDIEQIYVKGKSGLVSVANFAKVKKGLGPVTISRENRSRIVHVTAGILTDENSSDVEKKLKDGIASSFVVPEGITIAYEGSSKNMKEQKTIYGKIILMAIILVFGVMAATYESFKAPFINLMTIPFLIIGVVFIYKITGQVASMTSAIGLIMLVGIVVNNGIILVDYTNLLIDRGMRKKEACYQAGCSRLRPVMMTTLTTILGMIPMCLSKEGNASIVQPIGVAVVGGLTSSTFITLFFIPVIYSVIMSEKKKDLIRVKVNLPSSLDFIEEKASHVELADFFRGVSPVPSFDGLDYVDDCVELAAGKIIGSAEAAPSDMKSEQSVESVKLEEENALPENKDAVPARNAESATEDIQDKESKPVSELENSESDGDDYFDNAIDSMVDDAFDVFDDSSDGEMDFVDIADDDGEIVPASEEMPSGSDDDTLDPSEMEISDDTFDSDDDTLDSENAGSDDDTLDPDNEIGVDLDEAVQQNVINLHNEEQQALLSGDVIQENTSDELDELHEADSVIELDRMQGADNSEDDVYGENLQAESSDEIDSDISDNGAVSESNDIFDDIPELELDDDLDFVDIRNSESSDEIEKDEDNSSDEKVPHVELADFFRGVTPTPTFDGLEYVDELVDMKAGQIVEPEEGKSQPEDKVDAPALETDKDPEILELEEVIDDTEIPSEMSDMSELDAEPVDEDFSDFDSAIDQVFDSSDDFASGADVFDSMPDETEEDEMALVEENLIDFSDIDKSEPETENSDEADSAVQKFTNRMDDMEFEMPVDSDFESYNGIEVEDISDDVFTEPVDAATENKTDASVEQILFPEANLVTKKTDDAESGFKIIHGNNTPEKSDSFTASASSKTAVSALSASSERSADKSWLTGNSVQTGPVDNMLMNSMSNLISTSVGERVVKHVHSSDDVSKTVSVNASANVWHEPVRDSFEESSANASSNTESKIDTPFIEHVKKADTPKRSFDRSEFVQLEQTKIVERTDPSAKPKVVQKVMPKKENPEPNDRHVKELKQLNRVAAKPTVANSEKVSTGVFVGYKPAGREY